MPLQNLPENVHQRPHLEQFCESGGQEHIFANPVALEIMVDGHRQKETLISSTVMLYFRDFVIRL